MGNVIPEVAGLKYTDEASPDLTASLPTLNCSHTTCFTQPEPFHWNALLGMLYLIARASFTNVPPMEITSPTLTAAKLKYKPPEYG